MKLKQNLFVMSLFIIYSFFLFKYAKSIGLMDDYMFKYGSDRFSYNKNFLSAEYLSGGFKLLYPFQIWFQGFPLRYFENVFYYYFLNLILLFSILSFSYKVLKEYITLNPYIYFLTFFMYPFFFDYILHPSLQEKYIFIFFYLLLYLFKLNHNLILSPLIIAISILIPLIKIQAAPLWIILFMLYLKDKQKNQLYSLISLSISNIFVLLTLFGNSGYHSVKIKNGLDFNLYLNNLLNLKIILILSITFFFIFYNFYFEKNYFIYAISFYQVALVLLLIIDGIGGSYRYGIFIFSIAILVSNFFINDINKLIKQFLLVLFSLSYLISNFFIFQPKLERWYDLSLLLSNLNETKFNENIYFDCPEGIEYLNNLQENKIEFIESISELPSKSFLFISDSHNCSFAEESIKEVCFSIEEKFFNKSKYDRLMIKKYNCGY